MKRNKSWMRALLGIPLITLLPACQSIYLIEQGFKNYGVIGDAVDIETTATGEVRVEGLELSPDQQRKLRLINEIRQFAGRELGLEVDDAYTTYYEVPDGAISHVVTAAHPLALIAYKWRFPIVGRVAYKGFFDRVDAEAEQARLNEDGWDTHLSPVTAYSSLGWFDDPVLSTMLEHSDGDLADIIIHELTHRTVYFKNVTDINESMATVIGQRGARLFLNEKYGEESEELREFNVLLQWRAMRGEILRRLRFDLDALYRSRADDGRKLARKKELFAHALRLLYPGEKQPETALSPTNAFVVARKQYSDHIDLFEQVLEIFGGEPAEMMSFLKSLPESETPLPELRKLASTKQDRDPNQAQSSADRTDSNGHAARTSTVGGDAAETSPRDTARAFKPPAPDSN